MDSLPPEQLVGIAAGVIAVFIGFIVFTYYLLWPSDFASFFGCKIRSAPKTNPRGRRPNIVPAPNDSLELHHNPIIILQDRKVAEMTPL